MPTPSISPEIHQQILSLSAAGRTEREIAKQLGICQPVVNKYKRLGSTLPRANKKTGQFSWREWVPAMQKMQELKRKSSWSQDEATIELGDGKSDVALIDFSDQHMGAWSTDYSALVRITDEILNTPNLYVALTGDYAHYAIKLRNVLEVADNLLPPEQQTDFLEDWLNDLWPRVACATWENHGVERQEKQAGESSTKRLLSRKGVYANGILHADFVVGKQVYKGAFSHKFRGRSIENPVHGQMRYMRREGQDREFAMAGDSHVPGMAKYTDGKTVRVALNSGSIQTNSGYAKRYFSLKTHDVYPLLVLHHDRHEMTPYWSIAEWLKAKGGK